MANTYTQIYLHIIFAVYDHMSLIKDEWQEELYKYMAGACNKRRHHPIIINGVKDHVHLLVGMHPNESVSELVQRLKIETSKWIKFRFHVQKFAWQSGFAAFTYSKSLLPQVSRYIANQKTHHTKVSFDEEIKKILADAEIEYNQDYILHGVKDDDNSKVKV